jgi:hypothetical protein
MSTNARNNSRRRYLLIAAIAIGIVLLLFLTISQSDIAGHAASLILLPVFFIGVLPSPCVMARIEYMRLGFAPRDPARKALFQRPPPYPIA